MNLSANVKNDIFERLQKQILSMHGVKKVADNEAIDTGLGAIERAFPNHTFPIGAIHEFTSHSLPNVAATNSFITGIVSRLMQKGGSCLWISTKRTVFPPALRLFGVDPERVIFADASKLKDALWTIEEALKCEALAAVIGELSELSFTESRRLQLAVEHSHVTGFIHRHNARTQNTVACLTRWKIEHISSAVREGFPGVGLPRWKVQLLKVRNGMPGVWDMEWKGNAFHVISNPAISKPFITKRKAG